MQTYQAILLALTSLVGASSVLALVLRSFIQPLREHANLTSWTTDNVIVEGYATFVLGFCSLCDGAKKILDYGALNPRPNKPTIIVNGKVLP